jgi:hypothetical protein
MLSGQVLMNKKCMAGIASRILLIKIAQAKGIINLVTGLSTQGQLREFEINKPLIT